METSIVHVNDVESGGGTPGDRIELVNTGPGAADLSGRLVKDNGDTHVVTIPAGTVPAAGGYPALPGAATTATWRTAARPAVRSAV